MNQKYLQIHLNDFGIKDQFVMLSNGQEVIDYCEKQFEEILYKQDTEETPCQPISVLLLDINMPMLNGIEALILLKEKFKQYNSNLLAAQAKRELNNDKGANE